MFSPPKQQKAKKKPIKLIVAIISQYVKISSRHIFHLKGKQRFVNCYLNNTVEITKSESSYS